MTNLATSYGEAHASVQPDTVATVVADRIRQAGITRAFGMPGGEVLPVIEALRQVGTEFVLCGHESSAGMMASAYGLMMGTPGLVITTLGPGAANLLLPLANAELDREALIAICGDLPESWPLSHTHQRLDLHGIFSPVTKFCAALRPMGGAETMQAAIDAVSSPAGGAALLRISSEDAIAQATAGSPLPQRTLTGNSRGLPQDLDRVVTRLRQADRPLVVVGCGAEASSAPALRSWLERWGLPVVLTPKAKGMVGEDYERFVGIVDSAGLGELMSGALAKADLIVGLGLDPVELMRTWHATSPVLWVGECGRTPPAGEDPDNSVGSPVSAVVHALADLAPPAKWDDEFADVRAGRSALFYDEQLLTWIPRTVRDVLPAECILTTDVGSHKCLFGQFWPTDRPGTFLTSNGLSAMGYGLPAAIGAKLACPDQPVVAVVGDGGFAMTSQELETAARLGAPIIVIVVADTTLSLIGLLQETRQLPHYGVDYGRVDTSLIAAGYGARGVRATTPKELAAALSTALASQQSTVIEVPISSAGYRAIL